MALLPSVTQIPAQRVSLNEAANAPVYVSREWYRFLDALHTYTPTPAVFTPVFTPGVNVASLTAGPCFYNQMGSVISLTGSLSLTAGGAGDTVFTLAPPVLDNLSLSTAAGLFASTVPGVTAVGTVVANANALQFRVNATGAGAGTYVFNVNYQIV
jgi:hypothetical protein